MATVTLKGNNIETSGTIQKTGSKEPDFSLTTKDLETKTSTD